MCADVCCYACASAYGKVLKRRHKKRVKTKRREGERTKGQSGLTDDAVTQASTMSNLQIIFDGTFTLEIII